MNYCVCHTVAFCNRALSVINGAYKQPLISEVINWQCFLTVLILESTCAFRATVYCLFVLLFWCWAFLMLPEDSWHLLKLLDTSWCFIILPNASCCLLTPPEILFLLSLQYCHNIKIIIDKQTKYCASDSHKHAPK